MTAMRGHQAKRQQLVEDKQGGSTSETDLVDAGVSAKRSASVRAQAIDHIKGSSWKASLHIIWNDVQLHMKRDHEHEQSVCEESMPSDYTSVHISPNRRQESGASSDGLSTTVHPAAMAGMTFQTAMRSG